MRIDFQPLFEASVSDSTLLVSNSGFVITDESWHQEPMYASYSRLYYILEGAGRLLSDGEEMEMEPGFVYLAPCGMKVGFCGSPSVTKLFFHINLPVSPGGADLLEQIGHFARLPCPGSRIRDLKERYFASDPASHLLLKGELYATSCSFLEHFGIRADRLQRSKPVALALSYIRSHLRAGLTVEETATAVFCSRSKLSTVFREELGQSVSAYIEELLMSEAQTMLLYSDASVGEISERLGYCDQFYFSRRFKLRFGVSPREYRRR